MTNQSSLMTGITEPSLFHSEQWRKALEQTFGFEIQEFRAQAEPESVGFYSLISDLRGKRVVATPFSDFCDPTFETQAGWDEFVEHLLSYDFPVTVKPFTNKLALSDQRFEQRGEVKWHGIDLPDQSDTLWAGLKSSVRNRARKPEKNGIHLRQSSDLVDYEKFHSMHVGLRKDKYRMLAQPFEFFERLSEGFGDDMFVVLAEEGDRPVAGMVFFVWNGACYYKFGASIHHRVSCNRAMLLRACDLSIDRGLGLVDLGRSDVDQPGLVQFKEDFATQSIDLKTLHWAPENWSDPQGASAGSTLSAITDLLTGPEVDPALTKAGGTLLYRFFA